jgi:translation initiation factor IF-1
MAKEWVLERDGEVLEVLPAWFFKVRLKDVDTLVRCKKSWRMSQSNISIIIWDRVKLEINQYDMSQWRIIFRYNDYKQWSNNPTITNTHTQWWSHQYKR